MEITRRALLSGVSLAAFAFTISPLGAREYKGTIPWRPYEALPPDGFDGSRRFFTEQERAFVTAAVDRFIPADDYPSASELGVVDYIDSQLAGSYGRGDILYLHGPFRQGEATQGYQAREPAWLYRAAIADIEAHVGRENPGKRFADLSNDEQDAILSALEDGSLELETPYADTFFDTFLHNAIEGYFGDPVYGGNRGMEAWKMIGFPGARYDYRPYVSRHNERLSFEPVSVAGFAASAKSRQGE